MFIQRIVIFSLVAGSCASTEPEFTALLKRQAPGTPSYNCHDNCGTAITISKAGGDICSDEIFLYDYNNCLQCAGPDNHDIWKYYGRSLGSAAKKCGLNTEPKTGKQDDVGEARHLGNNDGTNSTLPSPASTSAGPGITSSQTDLATETSTVSSTNALTFSSAVEANVTGTAGEKPTSAYPTGSQTVNGSILSTSSPLTQSANAAGDVPLHHLAVLTEFIVVGGSFYWAISDLMCAVSVL